MFAPKPDYNKTIKIDNGEYIYIPNFYDKKIADTYLKRLLSDIKWKQESMNMYGKQIPFPRLTSWYGDNDKTYSFSGITLQPHPWSPGLSKIKSFQSSNIIKNDYIIRIVGSKIDLDRFYGNTDTVEVIKDLIEKHYANTFSNIAKQIIANWELSKKMFVKIMPTEYKLALEKLAKENINQIIN